MATKIVVRTPEMLATMCKKTAKILPEGFAHQSHIEDGSRVVFAYEEKTDGSDRGGTLLPIIGLDALVKLKKLFKAQDIRVKSDFSARSRAFEGRYGSPKSEVETHSKIIITVLL